MKQKGADIYQSKIKEYLMKNYTTDYALQTEREKNKI
jgi:hypothetical protein